MKTKPSRLQAAVTLLLGIIFIQATDMAKAQSVNPATGLPVAQTGNLPAEAAINIAYNAQSEVHGLIASGRYDEALQRCLSFHNQNKEKTSLVVLMPDWVELGRRFPKAKKALIEIRDHDVDEFSEDRGYFDLFQEVKVINDSLQQADSTYVLFKNIRGKDTSLAQQCYFSIESLLVSKGEYQYYYDQMGGDAQGKFDSIRGHLTMQLDQQKRFEAINQKSIERTLEMNRQRGITNSWTAPDLSPMRKKFAEDNFIGQTRQLIEVLIATGHKIDAEKIRDRALTVLEDSRLHSAVSDAEAGLHH